MDTIDNEIQEMIQELLHSQRTQEPNQQTSSRHYSRSYNELYDILGEYQENIRLYQENIREYQENIRVFLQIIYLQQYNQRTNTSHARNTRQTHNNIRTSHRENFIGMDANIRDIMANQMRQRYMQLPSRQPTRNMNEFHQTFEYIIPNMTFYNDVEVCPTPSQIATATQCFEYSSSMSNVNTSCPITLDDFQEGETVCQIKHCRHTFKEEAIRNWFLHNVRCPVCRYDIRDYREPELIIDNSLNNTSVQSSSPRQRSPNIRNTTRNSRQSQRESSTAIDTSYNEIPSTPSTPTSRATNHITPNTALNNIVQNISTELSGLLSNYLNHNLQSDITIMNNNSRGGSRGGSVYTFEIPLYYDLSGSRM
jgi:hypothetical protein